jgi:NADP-dependent aldehyde dehydrogenase
MAQELIISGLSLIGNGQTAQQGSESFQGIDPVTGMELDPLFYSATVEDIERAATLAEAASSVLAAVTGRGRANLLRSIAAEIATEAEAIVRRANLETGLPLPRLQGELARTTGQLQLFAELLEEGSWLDARIDLADPERKPFRRPDVRSMLRPLGPVVVFGASNFPLAFSVAGGDTASALAAGNPIIVKAHPAHPGTSELVGKLIQRAVKQAGLPAGVFALLFDSGIDVGRALVQHSYIKAVAFTGSASAGQALMRLCSERQQPIPCYAEMGSTNPLFILPGALRERSAALAQGVQASFTLGSGQFCTKPGLVFVPRDESAGFIEALRSGVETLDQQTMLTQSIASRYSSAVQQRRIEGRAQWIAGMPVSDKMTSSVGAPAIFGVTLAEFLSESTLEEEIFGPATLLVSYGSESELVAAAHKLHGHLTATIHATDQDLGNASELIRVLETKVGRILFNGYPTGVEVCHAMVHGGPFPATSDGRSTSVGTRAILRFTRPVCYQDFPDAALPPELQHDNPLGIARLVNGEITRSNPL